VQNDENAGRESKRTLIVWRVIVACIVVGCLNALFRYYWDSIGRYTSGLYYLLELTTRLSLDDYVRYESILFASIYGLLLGVVGCFSKTRRGAIVFAFFITNYMFILLEFPSIFILVGMSLGDLSTVDIFVLLGTKTLIWLGLPILLSTLYVALYFNLMREGSFWLVVRNTGLISGVFIAAVFLLRVCFLELRMSQDGFWFKCFAGIEIISMSLFAIGLFVQFGKQKMKSDVREGSVRDEK
jgi:hypothetical protein